VDQEQFERPHDPTNGLGPVFNATSCASCHHLELAFADTARLSSGVRGRHLSRNAPTLLNRAYGKTFFWDGRAASLEAGVLLPIENPDELALPLDRLVARLRASPVPSAAVS